MEDGKKVDGSFYIYAPNKGAPVFFAVAFLATGGVHLWQAIHYKSWKLTGLYILCALLFGSGFIVRELGAFEYSNLGYYIASQCLIYFAPPLYELCNYYILGRILYFVPYYSPIHPGRVLTTFAAISMVVEALNGNGIAYMANRTLPEEQQRAGEALMKASLILQLVVVSLFVVLAGVFQTRCRRNDINHFKVNQALLTLYISTAIIMVRCIYRTVEYFGSTNVDFSDPNFDFSALSPIVRYEWFFYVFEATLMLCNSVLLNARHPRRWLPSSTKVYLAKDNVTEIMGPGYKQERNFLVTLIDPFDIYGMIKGRDQATRFWDEHELEGRKTDIDPMLSTAERQTSRAV